MPTSDNYKLWTKQNKNKKLSESSGEFNTSQEKLKQNRHWNKGIELGVFLV